MSSEQPPSNHSNSNNNQKKPRWIWFITGPTACGKTTVAKSLAQSLGFSFVEGDDYHPKANVEKMSHNIPLTTADRTAWLEALRDHESAQPPANAPTPHLAVTCSALKREYRDVLRAGGEHAGDLKVRFVFLDVEEEVLRERARARKGHFAGEGLVRSQMEALERPDGEGDVVLVDVGRRKQEDVEAEVERRVREAMGI